MDSHGNEGATSAVNGVTLGGASSIVVEMAEGAINVPRAAVGCLAGADKDNLTRQNTAPLSIGSTWQLPTTGLVDGLEALGGQKPDYYIVLPRISQRG